MNLTKAEKFRQTMLLRYGVENPSQLAKFQEKKKQTSMKRYGTDHPSKCTDFQETKKTASLEKHGVDHPSKLQNTKDKVKKTNLERYGVEHPAKLKIFKEKAKQTNIKKRGVMYASQAPDFRQKVKLTNLEKYGVENVKQVHLSKSTIDTLANEELFTKLIANKTVREICTELDVGPTTVLRYVHRYKIFNLLIISKIGYETKIKDLLDNLKLNYIYNSRKIIPPQQLDFYLPDYNLAIEVGSSYYHGELSNNKSQNYHFDKWKKCKDGNIILFQFFDNDLIDNFHIVEFNIKQACNIQMMTSLIPDKLSLSELNDYSIELQFLNQNHLQGSCIKRNLAIGAYYNNTLVGVSTWFVNDNYCELIRFAVDTNYSCTNLFSRMLTKFNLLTGFSGELISFSDNRHSDGNLYKSTNFTLDSIIGSDYWYFKNFGIESKNHYQKENLAEIFNLDPNYVNSKTEWEIMQEQGYDRLWDAGKTKWSLKL